MPIKTAPLSAETGKWTIYAVGDIHGRADLLRLLRDAIASDVAGAEPVMCLTVLIGDYVDRGPSSADVLEILAQEPFPTRLIALRGNHEQMLLDGMQSADAFRTWARNGGVATLRSYGVRAPGMLTDQVCHNLQLEMRATIPATHRAFLESLPLSVSLGPYFFCHAGVRPGVPLHEQQAHDLLWIREEFLDCRSEFGKIVVHGHTPVPAVDVQTNRINVDTGAFRTGRLSGVKLDPTGASVFSVGCQGIPAARAEGDRQ